MTKFEKLKNYSELAWAAYADYISSGENGDISTTGLQIYNFRQNFELIIEESSRENSGFQAKIFKNRNTGEYILSIRGTEISLETYKDLIIADIGGLGTDSIPKSQYADM